MNKSSSASWRALSVIAVLAVALAACGSDDTGDDVTAGDEEQTSADEQATGEGDEVADPSEDEQGGDPYEALVEAAQAEGSVTFYSTVAPEVLPLIAEGFEEKYGIPVEYLRLSTGDMIARFSSEAESGIIEPDVMTIAGAEAVTTISEWADSGWVTPLSEVDIPSLGDFPERFTSDVSAVPNLTPYVLAYNTDLVEEPPTDWDALVDPQYQGQIILPEPDPSHIAWFSLMFERYGEEWFEQLRAQEPRIAGGVPPASNSLGAGEGALQAPNVVNVLDPMIEEGAPVDFTQPPATTGVEQQIFLPSQDQARSPNAGRLLLDYILSPEGNEIWTSLGSISPYDEDAIPSDYVMLGDVELISIEEATALLTGD